ncbi:MAG: DUF4145 domain-containing protein [Nitrospira sp.]
MFKCGHCGHRFHEVWDDTYIGWDTYDKTQQYSDSVKATYILRRTKCPDCERFIFLMRELKGRLDYEDAGLRDASRIVREIPILPEETGREPLPISLPTGIESDYKEACKVLRLSPKASAALSRRCLQRFLREVLEVTPGDLANEIQAVLEKGTLPTHLGEAIDAVRNVGNFAAHPIKSKHTGEVMEVEPGEAEWLIETLEGLFDFFFVKPEELKRRRAALEIRLKEAGKPPLK